MLGCNNWFLRHKTLRKCFGYEGIRNPHQFLLEMCVCLYVCLQIVEDRLPEISENHDKQISASDFSFSNLPLKFLIDYFKYLNLITKSIILKARVQTISFFFVDKSESGQFM